MPKSVFVESSVISDEDFKTTIEALKQIKKGHWTTAKRKIDQTQSQVSQDLYWWLVYTKRAKSYEFQQIADFIEDNPSWPHQSRLKLRAEQKLDQDTPEEVTLKWFDQNFPQTTDGMNLYLSVLLKRKQMDKVVETARHWWGTVMLTPQRQTNFLSRYGVYLDRQSHIDRLNKLLFDRHYTNARKLAMLLGQDYQDLVEARIALAEQKPGVDALIDNVPDSLKNDPGLVYERIRWRRKKGNVAGALDLMYKAPTDQDLPNAGGWWHERHILVREFLEKKDYKTAYNLVTGHRQTQGLGFAQAEFLSGWIALRFVDKPWEAFKHFETLFYGVSTPISKSRAAYWAGRASYALGHQDVAERWYRVAAKHQTTFYGQIAFTRMDKTIRPPILQAPRPQIQNKASFMKDPVVQATIMLSKAGLRSDASTFLTSLSNNLESAEDYALLADLSRDLNHLHNAIRIAKKGLSKNIFLINHAYPTLLSHMADIDIEWALVHGLIRQESAFDFQAQSHAGALGLMQLLPSTAKETARKIGIRHKKQWLTTSPEHNIKLGSAYLEKLLERFDGSYPLALAGYNAGPNRVSRWLKTYGDPRTGEIDILDWIELIPIYETRNYVHRVMEATYIYRKKLDQIQKNKISGLHTSIN